MSKDIYIIEYLPRDCKIPHNLGAYLSSNLMKNAYTEDYETGEREFQAHTVIARMADYLTRLIEVLDLPKDKLAYVLDVPEDNIEVRE